MGIKYGSGWGGARISLSRGSVLSREYFPSSLFLFTLGIAYDPEGWRKSQNSTVLYLFIYFMDIQNVLFSRLYNHCTTGCEV